MGQETRTRARQSQKIIEAERTIAENRALQVEKERLKELSQVLRSKLAEGDQETEELKAHLSTLQNKNSAMKHQMGGRQSRERNDPQSAQALRDKLMAQEEENKAIRESFRTALANSEQELDLVRKMASETKAIYERSLVEIQEQLQEDSMGGALNAFHSGVESPMKRVGRSGEPPPPSPRSQRIRAENDSLHAELSDMKKKYQKAMKQGVRQRSAR